MACPYAYFGLLPSADPEVVKLAVRLALLRDHPDHGGDAAALRRTQEARQALRDGTPLAAPTADAAALRRGLGALADVFRRPPGKR